MKNTNIPKIYDEKDFIFGKNSMTLIINGEIFDENKFIKKDIAIYQGKLVNPNSIEKIDNINIIDASYLKITSGMIDQHLHGGYGCNFDNCTKEELENFLIKIKFHGITSIIPTLTTNPIEVINRQIEIINSVNSKMIKGIHLEGPFISKDKKGIHPQEFILEPTIENFKKINDKNIKIVTLAPELDKNLELSKYLKNKDIVVSAGHTTSKDLPNEISQITHLFNATPNFHHRDLNITSKAFIEDVYTEIIGDLKHINPDILKIFFKVKSKDKIILVSDALPLAKSNEKKCFFANTTIFQKENNATDKNSTMAGSLAFLDKQIELLLEEKLITFEDFIKFTTINPSNNLKLNTGQIKEGFDADIVFWEDNKILKVI